MNSYGTWDNDLSHQVKVTSINVVPQTCPAQPFGDDQLLDISAEVFTLRCKFVGQEVASS